MSIPFFGKYDDEITFTDKDDLIYKFSQIDCTVPPREDGRKTFHVERESLKIYMVKLADMDKLNYPFKITKYETPDFIITRVSKSTIGLEQTEATTESRQQTFAQIARSPQKPFILPDKEPPVYGKELERKSALRIIDRITNKTIKLNKPNYKLFGRNELLIYTDMCPKGNEDIAIEFLVQQYNKLFFYEKYKTLFDSISIIFKDILRHNVIVLTRT